jgi:NAD(P)-dependent dehydrogenase (short-subunit alcohol dehydrogenase family)
MTAPPSTCLIAGASGGVATALAAVLRSRGWRLALAGRDAAKLTVEAGELAIAADVASEAGAAAAVAQAAEHFGAAPDALVNAAGAVLVAPLARTSEAQYRDCVAANLDTSFFLAKAYCGALQQAARDGRGHAGALLLFGSVAGAIGIANHPAVAAAKGAVEALTRALAADYAGIGLRVNAIAPGLLDTQATARFLSSDLGRKAMAAQYPLGRYGSAEDAAALAAFLISAEAGWITGQCIGLDGGFTAVRPALKVG